MGGLAGRNLVEEVEATLAAAGVARAVRALPPHFEADGVDFVAVSRSEEPARMPAADAPLGVVADVAANGEQLWVRCEDAAIGAIGGALERGEQQALAPARTAADRQHVVGILDQNATKALHLGHLRNVALGHAVTSLLRAAGAPTRCQSQIADAGRSMGEALAGWVRLHAGAEPVSEGLKSDHFVGRCYGDYVASLEDDPAADRDGALAREDVQRDDLAEELLRRCADGDPETLALWRRMRDWALSGQDATLARLGVRFDWRFLESDFTAEIAALSQRAIARGVARREPRGAVVYHTGDDHYPFLLLNRRDGFPTQHVRYMAVWAGTGDLLRGSETIQVIGDEWRALTVYADAILRALADGGEVHPGSIVMHGMLTVDGRAPKSSHGDPPLIDDLLDELEQGIRREPPWDEPCRLASGDAAAVVALLACLKQPAGKRLAFERGRLLDERVSPGWAIARAFAVALDPRFDGDPEPEPADKRYRFLVVRSQFHRSQVARACAAFEPEPLVRFYAHLSRWFLAAPPSAALARAMRTVLGSAFAALGLPRSGAAEKHQAGLEPAPTA